MSWRDNDNSRLVKAWAEDYCTKSYSKGGDPKSNLRKTLSDWRRLFQIGRALHFTLPHCLLSLLGEYVGLSATLCVVS